MQGEKAAILIVGGSGQVGTALRHLPWPQRLQIHAPTRQQLDVTDEAAIVAVMASRKWSCVINCAAYTAVDAAENDAESAWRANAVGPAWLAAATGRAGTPVIHLSTDYVFDGEAKSAYRPSDPVQPLGVYGRSKAAGEDAVRQANPRHVILRTSWVVSPFGRNFVKTMLSLATRQESLKVVNDQFGRPTSAADLAAAIQVVALRLIESADPPVGTYHFANAGRTTWYDIAVAIMAGARRRGAPAVPVEAIPTAAYPTPAQRPLNCELCTSTITRDFAVEPRPWPLALDEILDTLMAPPP